MIFLGPVTRMQSENLLIWPKRSRCAGAASAGAGRSSPPPR